MQKTKSFLKKRSFSIIQYNKQTRKNLNLYHASTFNRILSIHLSLIECSSKRFFVFKTFDCYFFLIEQIVKTFEFYEWNATQKNKKRSWREWKKVFFVLSSHNKYYNNQFWLGFTWKYCPWSVTLLWLWAIFSVNALINMVVMY